MIHNTRTYVPVCTGIPTSHNVQTSIIIHCTTVLHTHPIFKWYLPPPSQKNYTSYHTMSLITPSFPFVGGGGGTHKMNNNPNLPHLHSITGGPLVPQLLWSVWTPSRLNCPPITVHNRIFHFLLKLLQLISWGPIPHPRWQYVRLMHMTDPVWWWF
jgi:hypothetical protein